MTTHLNNDWKFFPTWNESVFSSDGGESVRIPHANVETPFNCFDEKTYQFESGYKRVLKIKKAPDTTYVLTFEGVAHFAEVFVNGKSVCTHNCGYTAFSADVTDFLADGDNQLVVRVDSRESLNQPPFGFVIDYLTYGGIYREVYLEQYKGVYVQDVFVQAEPQKPIRVEAELAKFKQPCPVLAEISDGEQTLWQKEYNVREAKFAFTEQIDLKPWSVDNPNVYTLKLTVGENSYETTFGVRSAVFTKDGFFLNGKKMKIVGLNRHQCFPYVGYAMPESMQRRDARILKNVLCVNTVRTSHYPQSKYFLDECDRLGLLVVTEIPGWQHLGDDEWKKVALDDVWEMVLQYRNHPSVVLWGVRINESADCDDLYLKTNALAHELDPTRQTGGIRNFKKSHLLEDVYTFNDFDRRGASDRNTVCDKNAPYMVTEYNGHMFPTKTYDDFPHQREHVLRYARMLNDVYDNDGICGAIGWCMFDYNTHKDFGSGDRICYHGVTDMFRNPKIAAGVFSSFGKKPFLDVCFTSDIGDYPEGGVGAMYCLTNADYIDVYKGEYFVKKYTHADSPFKNMPNAPILIDDLIGDRLTVEDGIAPKYAKMLKEVLDAIWNPNAAKQFTLKTKMKILRIMKGTGKSIEDLVALHNKYRNNWGSEASALTIKAYKSGELVAEKTVGCAENVKIVLEVSSTTLHEHTTYDVAAVNIRAVDEHGNVAPYVSKVVHLRCEGAVEIIGDTELPLLGGRSGTFVKTVGKTGKGRLFVDDQAVEFEVV